MKKITQEWLEKAEGDWKVATREFNYDEPVYDIVCFHAHQCVEKYMKAILIENEIHFEKIHDLEILLNQCKEILPELLIQKEALIWLTQYSVRVRYPGFEAMEDDAKKAVKTAEEIREMIRNYFNLEPTQGM